MANTPFDAEKFKSVQKTAWTSVAEGWHTGLAPSLIPVTERLISFVTDFGDTKVLDLACGDGSLALAAAKAGAVEVTAADISNGFESIIEKRARESGVKEQVAFKEADLERLPFEEKKFDVVLCQFGLMFAMDRKKTFQEIYRVLK